MPEVVSLQYSFDTNLQSRLSPNKVNNSLAGG